MLVPHHEKLRNIMKVVKVEKQNSILVAGYALLSTGVNIKRLHNLIMASPLKSYTTITQSIGRLMRLHPDKSIANIYDLVDNFGIRKPGGPYYKQYEHRRAMSYNPEEFPIKEAFFKLF
jgi:superfamily II DNA or RNA helicase